MSNKEYTIEEVWDSLIEMGVATEEELNLITNINGYSMRTLNDVIYAREGMNDYAQLIGEDDEEV